MDFKSFFNFKNIIFLLLILLTIKFVSNVFEIFMLCFAAFVLSSSLEPAVKFLEKKMSRMWAAVTVIISTLLVTVALFIPILKLAIEQIVSFSLALPKRLLVLQNLLQDKQFFADLNVADMIEINHLVKITSNYSKNIVDSSLHATMGFFTFIVFLIMLFMIMFYLIKDKEYIMNKFIEFLPQNLKSKGRHIVEQISEKVGGYFIAQVISNIAIWVMVTIVLLLFRVDYAVVLGLIAGVFDIIPILGPTVALLLILICAYHLGVVKIIGITLCFLLVQQISNSLVRPFVFGKFLDLHPIVVLLAILICADFFGVLAVILAPAIAATVTVLVDELYLIPMNGEKTKDE